MAELTDRNLLQANSKLYLIKTLRSEPKLALESSLKIKLLKYFSIWYKHLALSAKDDGFIEVCIEKSKKIPRTVEGKKELNKVIGFLMSEYAESILSHIDTSELLATLIVYNTKAFELGAKTALKGLGFSDSEFKLDHPIIDLNIKSRIKLFAAPILFGTLHDVRKIIRESLFNGEFLEQDIVKKIETDNDDIGIRSKRISKTEIHHGYSFGIFETFKNSGIIKKKWVILHEDTRPSHKRNYEEGWVDINHVYLNGETYPGEGEDSIGGCQCILEGLIGRISEIRPWNGSMFDDSDIVEIPANV